MKMKNKSIVLLAAVFVLLAACSKEDTYNITPSGVTSDFTFTISDLDVTFTNGAAKYKSFIWVFGDGKSSTEQNPVHTYEAAGTYKAQLTAFGPEGAVVISSKPLTVVDPRPVSKFGAKLTELTVALSDSSKLATSWEWDFGDGSAKVTTQNASHSYPELVDNNVKVYTIKLKVTNAKGTSTSSQDINIFPIPTADFTYALDATATGKEAGRKVIFTSSSTNATAYSWDFGDFTTSESADVIHLFPVTGYTYTVKFTASNPRRAVSVTKSVAL
jgi:PKD repeat protein